ncbi:MAG: hypothetical protein MUC60_15410 [Oscillatoria sp. Prado101]|nr:hypothetical protein [Oscillatoria sp. Prado101]
MSRSPAQPLASASGTLSVAATCLCLKLEGVAAAADAKLSTTLIFSSIPPSSPHPVTPSPPHPPLENPFSEQLPADGGEGGTNP